MRGVLVRSKAPPPILQPASVCTIRRADGFTTEIRRVGFGGFEGEEGKGDGTAATPLQKESQVRFEIPEEIPVEHEYMRQMLPENQKIKKF